MAKKTHRKNEAFVPWLRALVFALSVFAALSGAAFYPAGLKLALAVIAGGLAIVSAPVATLLAVVAVALPLMGADLIVGAVFLVVGLVGIQYLAQDDAESYLVIALAFLLLPFKASWAVVALAGYMLGTSTGAVAALVACAAIEIAGLLLGTGSVSGVLASGAGARPALSLAKAPQAALAFGWLGKAFSAADPARSLKALTPRGQVPLLLVQPILWAVGAAVSGAFRQTAKGARRLPMGLAAVVAGVAVVGGASYVVTAALKGPVPSSSLLAGAAISAVVAAAASAVLELVFPPVLEDEVRAESSMNAEEADVDELLRTISAAEDALASKHTVSRTVMITDMKSFSRITQEEGSVLTAKMIQRHRDLLLPLIEAQGGHGKSTGGDGLLAAFDDPSAAVTAAVQMQCKLKEHNTVHTDLGPISIRIGMASGEVVVDKGGRPFIGDALNRAARVMDLADGGQVFASSDVADRAPGPARHVHGDFNVKNISGPVRVVEILWDEGQTAYLHPREGKGPEPSEEAG